MTLAIVTVALVFLVMGALVAAKKASTNLIVGAQCCFFGLAFILKAMEWDVTMSPINLVALAIVFGLIFGFSQKNRYGLFACIAFSLLGIGLAQSVKLWTVMMLFFVSLVLGPKINDKFEPPKKGPTLPQNRIGPNRPRPI